MQNNLEKRCLMSDIQPNYIVGAYASAPSILTNDFTDEAVFYEKIITLPQMRGFEIPFWGDEVHALGNKFLTPFIKDHFENTLTCVPCAVNSCKIDSKIGLASKDEEAREYAVSLHKKAYEFCCDLNNKHGKNSFLAVQLASAPQHKNNQTSFDSFAKSLEEIASWNWDSTAILIEHCDAFSSSQKVEKGYMPIEDEIQSIKAVGYKRLGMVINTGRSAIEGQSISKSIEHIQLAQSENLLRGVMFSGVSSEVNDYGPWKDLHMPFGHFKSSAYPYDDSALTEDYMSDLGDVLTYSDLLFLGFKLLPSPSAKVSMDERYMINEDAVDILNACIKK